MESTEFSNLNIEFIFLGHKPDAAEVVRTALADRRLLGFVSGAVERELATEVLAEVATVTEARDAVLYRVDAKGKLREGSRVTRLVHELKNSTGADYVLVNGEEIDGPTPDEEVLGDYPSSMELVHGPKLKSPEVVLASGIAENVLTFWDSGTGLMAMPAEPIDITMIARSNRPVLSVTRTGATISALVLGRPSGLGSLGRSTGYYVDLSRTTIIDPDAGSQGAALLEQLDASLLGWDDADIGNLSAFITDAAALERAKELVSQPATLEGLREFVALLGFDDSSINYLMEQPLPANVRVVLTGGAVDTIKAVLGEFEREATGIAKLAFRYNWKPKALIGSSFAVLASGAAAHALLSKSKTFAWVPAGARRLLMAAWYADGAFYLAKGIFASLRGSKAK
ncbi:hypothetical protein AUR04nite_33580 [Glutamicibacter uratoxydans]|uniref:Uncharacterized protein n=1 Tax=Glutamicibacter uratoxydans TaxID=43667 RepID=A0A4Y4DSE3_GLUUR|nr:hypothetical protein [Glutamicibacter uratoxydans]GED07826.1 hypothetical protein AUR04nite_33580 [Glutamicibacter uratoxydans]